MDKKEHIVISLGGSLIVPDQIDADFLKSFVSTIKEYVNKGYHFVIITGGGKTCRRYQKALSDVSESSSSSLDWLGIYATRLNAEFMRLIFGSLAHSDIIIDPNIVPETDRPIMIGAGWKPGWSSDYDAVVIAEQLNVKRIINLSNIDHAYDKDPKIYPDAKMIKESSWKDFRALLPKEWNPGLSSPFDPIAAEKAESLSLEVVIVNGRNMENLKNYIDNKEFIGTVIK
ncbi:MAG TPA: UMP kinase [Candidatus Paceibacterota bacterium]|nr:UMP kinase [Candidatus Paceibacterota bacterium]